jgi:general stress protein 26
MIRRHAEEREHDALPEVAPPPGSKIMSRISLADIAKEMTGIDIAILSTHTESGEIANHPMSNNGDVTYDGTSYYFTYEQAAQYRISDEIRMSRWEFSSEAGLFSKGVYVAVEGTAELIRDKAAFKQHWTSDLDKWFNNGIDTPGIVLIKVKAKRATYWKGREEVEL